MLFQISAFTISHPGQHWVPPLVSNKNYKTVKQVEFQLSEGKEESGYHTHSNTLYSYIYSPF